MEGPSSDTLVLFLSQYPCELDCSQLSSLSSSLSAASFFGKNDVMGLLDFFTFFALVDLLSSETLATFAAAGFESWVSSSSSS